jgi:hypothetical protein
MQLNQRKKKEEDYMADNFNSQESAGSSAVSSPAVAPTEQAGAVKEVNVPQGEKKGTLKGMLMMAICCAAPLLLLAAIPFLGAAFGSLAAVGSGLLSIVALLACPVGMFLMMRMMMKGKKEDEPSNK